MKHNLNEYKDYFSIISEGNPKWIVGIYVRLSKEDGNSVSLSIKNQMKVIAKFIRNCLEDFEIYDIYVDDGLTGTDFDRKDYERLNNDVESKLINCIIVKDLTRYSRNLADGIKGLDTFVLQHHIRFISLGIPEVDTLHNPTAISSAEVYQALQSAEDYARVTSIKVRDIKTLKREAGEKNGGFPPYGYLPNPDGEHWLYDPVAGSIKKQMFKWNHEGMGDLAIARKLNEMKIPNPTAYKKSLGLKYYNPHANDNSGLWWPETVSRILTDQNNIGCSVQGKSSSFDHKRHKQIPKPKDEYVVVPGCHEKTIDDEFFWDVQEKRKLRTRVSKKTGEIHLFANLVYCPHCDRTLKKTSSKNHAYLTCTTYKLLPEEVEKHKISIPYEDLENIVLKTVQSQVQFVIDMQFIVEKINSKQEVNNHSERLEMMIKGANEEYKKTEHIIDASYYDWKENIISKEQYQRISKEMSKKLNQLKSTIRTAIEEQQKMKQGIKKSNDYFETFLKYKNITQLDRTMLVELIDKIYINDDKSVEVHFKFNNQYLLILDYIKENNEQIEKNKILLKK